MRFLTKTFCASTLIIFSFHLNAMDPIDVGVCEILNRIQNEMNPLQAQLFPYTMLKKAENPTFTLEHDLAKKLVSANLIDTHQQMTKSVQDAVKHWAKTHGLTQKKDFENFLQKTNN